MSKRGVAVIGLMLAIIVTDASTPSPWDMLACAPLLWMQFCAILCPPAWLHPRVLLDQTKESVTT